MSPSFRLFLLGLVVFLLGVWIGQARSGNQPPRPEQVEPLLEQSYADGWNAGARYVSIRAVTRREKD